MVRKDINLLVLVSTAIMVRSFGFNPLQRMFRDTFKDKQRQSLVDIFRKLCLFGFLRASGLNSFYQGELRRAATFFAPFFCSVMCDQYFFFSLLLCYKRIGLWFSCASIELWMRLGSLESTREARVALSYRFVLSKLPACIHLTHYRAKARVILFNT